MNAHQACLKLQLCGDIKKEGIKKKGRWKKGINRNKYIKREKKKLR